MKIIIEDDVFNIVERVKEIDENYYIIYDTKKGVFELHCKGIPNTFCLTIGSELDSRVIDTIYYTNCVNIDNICDDIDKNNENIERCRQNIMKDYTDYSVREIYKYCSNSSKDFNNAFSTKWK